MQNHSGGSRGLVVALIGSDGSGKSTVSRWLAEELKGQFDTKFLYFGTGDGPGSLLIKSLNWLKNHSRYGKAGSQQCTSGGTGNTRESGKSRPPDIMRLIWAATAVSERMSKMRVLKNAARAGRIVITDRYPQAEFWGIHDGPRLGYLLETRNRGLLHRIARWEHVAYVKLAQQKPDLVLLLDVAPEIAHDRRGEEAIDELRRRIKFARALTFQGAERIVLNSSEPLPVVKQQALQAVLNVLSPPALSEASTHAEEKTEGAHTKID